MTLSPTDKAKELVNMYYAYAKTQEEAIQMVDNVLLTTMCQKIDDLHTNTVISGDMDENFVKPSIQVLKWLQEVAYEVSKLKK